MLRSLFAGVTGLQAHQIAMDVESNNIANVNTIGYKYSRANFSDLLAQTSQIATAPQGDIGGKNAVQVGLGTTISSVTRIMTQGSIQNTDKNTDVAIQGDGFFIVSSDAGSTYKYSRSGDFKFDAAGNFVDNNGFVVQGWVRDEATGKVDSTAPISNINIPPGLTTPANATADVVLKANLDSGETVETFNATNSMDSYNLEYASNYAVWQAAGFVPAVGGALPAPPNAATQALWYSAYTTRNANTNSAENMNVMFNEQGQSLTMQPNQGVWVSYKDSVTTIPMVSAAGAFTFTLNGTTISGTTSGVTLADDAATVQQAINAQTANTGVSATVVGSNLVLTNDNSRDSDGSATKNIVITGSNAGALALGFTNQSVITAYKYTYTTNAADATPLINSYAVPTTSVPPADSNFTTTEQLRLLMETHAQYVSGSDPAGTVAPAGVNFATGIKIIINDRGQFEVSNLSDGDANQENLKLQVTGYSDPAANVTKNERFTALMQSINGTVVEGSTGIRLSQSMNAATHSASIDVYDSLGSKHTLKMDFRKTSVDVVSGSTWSMKLSVPEPGEINTIAPINEFNGQVRFGPDGALSSYTPTNITYTANNGSSPNQTINIKLGTANAFDGVTSFDATSGTSGISQDGFPGGDLVGIRIDQSGTLVGSFSNGRSFGLAQMGMAKFTNNEGLVSDGGNVYLQSANSGDPIIGTAATAGRGFMQSSSLEASNVDLSKSLTQLIIIQRGYQANGKTITTSDTLLETLLGIKR
ncbi:flagellar hook protein FlgE [Sulfuricurvum kujiense DSM 16994]|uniref:Flagellar hook protein FlgE n=1 Tax=Sulfuricurvum kujiense (strain ATCC BAA-921 / DSM 16994 / JCM 11577 / YK-1) TaxID=709032 RepID=E4TWB0_SULKY|nr:flagellar hook protein FlgE [Sulfuricurvum kujiense]ADR32726.1 flagellar hook protein FlgE [Sulfuricurvum kujiense DSM 16994]